MCPQKVGLSRNELILLFTLEKMDKEVFTISEVYDILKNSTISLLKE